MMLTEVTVVPADALPVAMLKDHLRLGAGFAMAPDQDGLLQSYLRAAMAVIEGRIAKALLERGFRWQIPAWRETGGRGFDEQALPLAPVTQISAVLLLDAGGTEHLVPPSRYRLIPDLHRPRLAAKAGSLPQVPQDGAVVIEFDAGFGPDWSDLPADLQQAVLLLAAEYYEHRHNDAAAGPALPPMVSTLIERWRQVRVLAGRAGSGRV